MSASDTLKHYKQLDDETTPFADSELKRIMLQAGPGAGKSFALMGIVERLMCDGVLPSRILVLAYNRTAVKNLQSDLADLFGGDEIQIRTIHDHCLKNGTGRRNRLKL